MRNWTPEERAKQAEAIRRHKPWEKSTGPKTEAGKQRTKNNGLKHGAYSGDANLVGKALHLNREFVRYALLIAETDLKTGLLLRDRTDKR